MTKSEYAILLTDPRWNEVRLRILHRDKLRCTRCKGTDCRLNVHHKIYLTGKLPWEVPDRFLVTLCDRCHEKAHENRLISSFVKDSIPSTKKKRENRNTPSKRGGKIIKYKKQRWVEGKGLIKIDKKAF